MSPASRRTLLRTCGLAVAGGLAGCIAAPGTRGTAGRPTDRTNGTTAGRSTTTDDTGETPTDAPAVDATLAARNESDREVRLTVELRRGDEVLADATRTLTPGLSVAIDTDVAGPGTYTVVASLESGSSGRTEWTVDPGYDGTLEVVVTGDGRIEFRELLRGAPCPTEGLPYAVPGAEETFTAGSLVVRNERDRPTTPWVSVSHDGETFFECGFDLDRSQSVTVDGLTATAGTFDVVADLPDGGRTEYEWRVPTGNNYPRLHVVIPTTYDSLVGCGPGGEIDVTVENPAASARTGTLTLLRDGDPVAEETADVPPNGETDVSLGIPIGDTYTLEVTTDAGTARTEVVRCYCYESLRTTVELDGSTPHVETTVAACE